MLQRKRAIVSDNGDFGATTAGRLLTDLRRIAGWNDRGRRRTGSFRESYPYYLTPYLAFNPPALAANRQAISGSPRCCDVANRALSAPRPRYLAPIPMEWSNPEADVGLSSGLFLYGHWGETGIGSSHSPLTTSNGEDAASPCSGSP